LQKGFPYVVLGRQVKQGKPPRLTPPAEKSML
jgi:hypothetical protein